MQRAESEAHDGCEHEYYDSDEAVSDEAVSDLSHDGDGAGAGTRTRARKRKFKPNIHTVRVLTPWGSIVRMKLSAKAIKTGVITMRRKGQAVKFPLVRALRGTNREFSQAQKG